MLIKELSEISVVKCQSLAAAAAPLEEIVVWKIFHASTTWSTQSVEHLIVAWIFLPQENMIWL